MKAEITGQLQRHAAVMNDVAEQMTTGIEQCAGALVKCLANGGKLLVMGNGGSAADAQHLAAELVGRFQLERQALPAIALTTDTSALTAIGNDYGFDEVFRRQVRALASPGDAVMGISTSGNSENVARGLQAAADLGCRTIGLLGGDGGRIGGLVDLALVVPSKETPRIQEAHVTIIHILCSLVDAACSDGSIKEKT